jgi:hypothetical protein
MVLRELGLNFLLTLEQRSDVALKLDDFAGDGKSGTRADEATGHGAEKHGAGEEKQVTSAHLKNLRSFGSCGSKR